MKPLLLGIALFGGCQDAGTPVDVYVTDYMASGETASEPLGGRPSRRAVIYAAPGEFEPVSFVLRSTVHLRDVVVSSGDLVGPAGTISADRVRVRVVQWSEELRRPILADLEVPAVVAPDTERRYWATVEVPAGAEPGTYEGAVTITALDTPVVRLELELEVLPIDLRDPPFALGYNYSSPKHPDVLAAHLADMRAHGMTTVAPLYEFHLPVDDDDTSELGEFIEMYLEAGFRGTLFLAAPMQLSHERLLGYGPVDSRRFQRKYIEVMRRLQREVDAHGHPTLFSIGDEFTNWGLEAIDEAGKLARLTYEELPEIATTSDMNGYREVMEMAPWLNVATFNNGWDGIDGHNDGRRLVNERFLRELQERTNAIPWFVNTGSGRFPFGFFFWRMTRLGVRGKIEWYYNLGDNHRGSVVWSEDSSIRPTLDYERSREGIDDLKYLLALEDRIERARVGGSGAGQVEAAIELLDRIERSITPDWTVYSQGNRSFPPDGFDVVDPERASSLGSLNALRRAVVERILALDQALGGGE